MAQQDNLEGLKLDLVSPDCILLPSIHCLSESDVKLIETQARNLGEVTRQLQEAKDNKIKMVRFAPMAQYSVTDDMQKVFHSFKPNLTAILGKYLKVGELISTHEVIKDSRKDVHCDIEEQFSEVRMMFTFSAYLKCYEPNRTKRTTSRVRFICHVHLSKVPATELMGFTVQDDMYRIEDDSIRCELDESLPRPLVSILKNSCIGKMNKSGFSG